jgi:cell shape-determining protein MreC
LAQQVELAAQSIGFEFSGVDRPASAQDHYALRYADFTVPLVKAVQELSAENEALKAKVEALEQDNKRLLALEQEVAAIKALLGTQAKQD